MRCRLAAADVLAEPDPGARRVSQCLFGERVDVLERQGDWMRLRNRRDGYAGFARQAAFHGTVNTAGTATGIAGVGDAPGDDRARRRNETVRLVGVRATLLFERPDMKSPLRLRLPFGAALDVTPEKSSAQPGAESRFLRVHDPDGDRDSYVWRAHCLEPTATLNGTLVDVARRLFDGAPYLWGGRTPDGADCSGLLQGAALARGLHLPRDSAEQEQYPAHDVAWAARAASDAVFWPGHVGLLIDPDTVFHATAHTLATAIEPLAAIIERAGEPSSIRRLPTQP